MSDFFSTDTKLSFDALYEYFENADIIFHNREIDPCYTSVHASYSQLALRLIAIKQKIWLYGYQPGELPPAIQDGFLGFIKRGQEFEF